MQRELRREGVAAGGQPDGEPEPGRLPVEPGGDEVRPPQAVDRAPGGERLEEVLPGGVEEVLRLLRLLGGGEVDPDPGERVAREELAGRGRLAGDRSARARVAGELDRRPQGVGLVRHEHGGPDPGGVDVVADPHGFDAVAGLPHRRLLRALPGEFLFEHPEQQGVGVRDLPLVGAAEHEQGGCLVAELGADGDPVAGELVEQFRPLRPELLLEVREQLEPPPGGGRVEGRDHRGERPRLAECVEPDHGFRELAGVLDGHHDAGRVRDVLQRVRAVGGGSRGGRGGEHGQDEQAGHAVAPRADGGRWFGRFYFPRGGAVSEKCSASVGA